MLDLFTEGERSKRQVFCLKLKRNSVSLKYFVPPFHFQTINHCLESKIPNWNRSLLSQYYKLGLCLFFPSKSGIPSLLLVSSQRESVEGLADFRAECLPSALLSGPYCIWRASSLGSQRYAQSWVGRGSWLVGGDGGKPLRRQDQPDSWALKRGRQCILWGPPKNAKGG